MITDTPKESLDVANIEYDLPCEDDLFESNPTKLNVVFSPPINYILIGVLFIFHVEN